MFALHVEEQDQDMVETLGFGMVALLVGLVTVELVHFVVVGIVVAAGFSFLQRSKKLVEVVQVLVPLLVTLLVVE